jgi:hypothetical protein
LVNSFDCSRLIAVTPLKPLNRARTGHIKASCKCLKVDADGVLPIVCTAVAPELPSNEGGLSSYRVEAP